MVTSRGHSHPLKPLKLAVTTATDQLHICARAQSPSTTLLSPRPVGWRPAPIVEQMTDEVVTFHCQQQGGVDTSTSAGKLTLAILGAVAEFENDIRRERQKDGIERAKGRGAYLGRKATIDVTAVRQLKQEGVGAAEIGRRLNIGRASLYRCWRRITRRRVCRPERRRIGRHDCWRAVREYG